MLPLSHRLPTPQVSDVLRRGKRIHGEKMTVIHQNQASKAPEVSTASGVSRFAFVAGVKVSKKAVERNHVKRLLRESVQHLLPVLKSGFDVVIVAKKELVGLGQVEVEEAMETMLKNIA